MTARRAMTGLRPREGEPRIYSVSEIVLELRSLLQTEYPHVIVQGEITDLRRSPQGHLYFRLKDRDAQLQVAFFAGKARMVGQALQNGISAQAEGEISVYPARGDMQLIAERVAPVGYGALQAQFEALKRKLQAEGLFTEERKRSLPRYPTRVGLVTSTSGAAIRDMLRVLRQRAPYARITVAPTRVQGEGAAEEIAAAIALMNAWGQADVLIVGRGGGSLEDLWAFNEEAVVRAIATSRIPVVSAVGHEVDVTLADLAADVRAATPTHAAQQVVLDRDEVRRTLRQLSTHARDRLRRELERERARLRGLRTHRAFREPHRRVEDAMQRVDQARDHLERALKGWVVVRGRRLDLLGERIRANAPERAIGRVRERLRSLDHRAGRSVAERLSRLRAAVDARGRLLGSYDYHGVLRRGYALVWNEDGSRLVNRARGLRADEAIQVEFEDARVPARVTRAARTTEEEPA
jgi:exodeoxyribonuclease VII large subunit